MSDLPGAWPSEPRPPRSGKSTAAFRTISEVSEELDVPQHVLRFWETKFAQVKPMKRAGGRRYYRPEDVALLRNIRDLLYRDGFTIRGAQKHLREGGARGMRRGRRPGGTGWRARLRVWPRACARQVDGAKGRGRDDSLPAAARAAQAARAGGGAPCGCRKPARRSRGPQGRARGARGAEAAGARAPRLGRRARPLREEGASR